MADFPAMFDQRVSEITMPIIMKLLDQGKHSQKKPPSSFDSQDLDFLLGFCVCQIIQQIQNLDCEHPLVRCPSWSQLSALKVRRGGPENASRRHCQELSGVFFF